MRRLLYLTPLLLLGGCFSAAVPLVPRVNLHVNGSAAEPRTSAPWHRVIRSADGSELRDARGRALVAWHSVAPAGRSGSAWVGIEETCYGGGDPSSWAIISPQGVPSGELLRVVESPRADGNEVAALHVGGVLERVSVKLNEEVRWLAQIPKGAGWRMVLTYGPVAADRALDVRPCPLRWVEVPLREYVSAASGGQTRQDPERLLEVDPQVATRLGMIGVPEYDLQQLHQVAMTVEFGGSLPAGVPREAVQAQRAAVLQGFRRHGGTDAELCALGSARGLFHLKLKLWGGDSTVPSALRSACSFSG